MNSHYTLHVLVPYSFSVLGMSDNIIFKNERQLDLSQNSITRSIKNPNHYTNVPICMN